MMERKSLTIWMMVIAAILSQMTGTANAARYWIRDIGDWFDENSWDPPGLPVHESTDSAYIDNDGTAEITAGNAFAYNLLVGASAGKSGNINQSGGTADVYKVYLGNNGMSTGTYNLSQGHLSGDWEVVGLSGTGHFEQTGGTNSTNTFVIGLYAGGEGECKLSGTDQVLLSSIHEIIGQNGKGTFHQSGGTNSTAGNIIIGQYSTSKGIYNLSGTGKLSSTGNQIIGESGPGTFNQSGGTNTVHGSLILGSEALGDGTYTISGGELTAGEILIGYQGTGHFEIADSDPSIAILDKLLFGADSTFMAVPGSRIHMDGASLENWNKNEAKLSGLNNLALIFEGGVPAGTRTFEVAGEVDRVDGFSDNFALAELILGASDVGIVQLVDNWNNGNRGDNDECLFTRALTINDGSSLDLNELKIYGEGNVEDLWDSWIGGGNTGRLFDGTLTGCDYLNAVYVDTYNWTTTEVVPEPATLFLFGLGSLALRRKYRAK